MYADFDNLREKLQACYWELTRIANAADRVKPGSFIDSDLNTLKKRLQAFADRLKEDCGIEGEFEFVKK